MQDEKQAKEDLGVFRCPCCDLDITEEVEKWLARRNAAVTTKKNAETLLDLIRLMHETVMEQSRKGMTEDELIRQTEREERIVRKIQAERERLVRKKEVLLRIHEKAEEAAAPKQRRKRTNTEISRMASHENVRKAVAAHEERRKAMLSDVQKHREYLELETRHVEAQRISSAKKAYYELCLERTVRKAGMLMMYRTHGKKIFMAFEDEQTFRESIAKYPSLLSKPLYARRFDLEDGNSVCGLYYVTNTNTFANRVWVVGMDVSPLYPSFSEKERELERIRLDRLAEKARRLNLLDDGGDGQ